MEAKLFLRILLISRHIARSERFRELFQRLSNARSPEEILRIIEEEVRHLGGDIERLWQSDGIQNSQDLINIVEPGALVGPPDLYLLSAFASPMTDEEVEGYVREMLEIYNRHEDTETTRQLIDELFEKFSKANVDASNGNLPTNIDLYEAACVEWFIQFDNGYFRNLSSQDLKALTNKLAEIKDQLSSSQLEELHEVRELYWSDPFSVDAAWKDKAIRWLSTLNEDLHTDIQEAYEIVNPPTHGMFRRINQSPPSESPDNTAESTQRSLDSGASSAEVESSARSEDNGVREGTETSPEVGSTADPSPQEQVADGLYSTNDNEPGSTADRLLQVVDELYGIKELDSTDPLSPHRKPATKPIEPIDTTIGEVNPDPSESSIT